MPEGIYTAFKRFAVHDGPGIRTTLFLKGCSLHCLWCHNPETISVKPQLLFHDQLCRNCGRCAAVCSCHSMENGVHRILPQNCRLCGRCEEACFNRVLELAGKKISVDEAAEQLLKDREFYAESGGGITLSGGEPLLQHDFCRALLERTKREGIQTAVDTCGQVPWSSFEAVLEVTDLFLYDFKVSDPEKHRQFTGHDNKLIKENLRRISAAGKRTEIRMIQLPGMNMSDEDLRGAGEFLAPLQGVCGVRLLAYHDLARSKYRAAGMEDTMPRIPSPSEAEMEHSAEILSSFGLKLLQ